MLRRKPTRVELKLDDLEEWNQIKKEKELEKRQKIDGSIGGGDTPATEVFGGPSTPRAPHKRTREIIQERIGYDPRPVTETTRVPRN